MSNKKKTNKRFTDQPDAKILSRGSVFKFDEGDSKQFPMIASKKLHPI